MSVVKPEDAYEQWRAAILDKPLPVKTTEEPATAVTCPPAPERPILKLKKGTRKNDSKKI